MPNWCDTIYKCVGDKNQLTELNELLESHHGTWIDSFLESMGVDLESLKKQGLRCRGTIESFEYNGDNLLTIYQQTAWCEQEGFRISIEERFPGIKVYFMEEEPGCDVYYTNDLTGEFFSDRFVLHTPQDTLYFESLEGVIDYLKDKYGIEVKERTFKEASNAVYLYSEQHEDDYLCLHEFQYCE